MTFLQMQTRVGELINQAVTDDTKTVTETEVKANLNIGYHKLVNAIIATNEDYYLRLAKADLVASQATYALPSDARKLKRLEVGYESSAQRHRATKLDRDHKTDPQGSYATSAPAYFLLGDQIELDPVPSDTVTDGLWLWYVEDQADLSDDADVPALPNGYHYIPVLYAVAKAKQRLGLLNEAEQFLAEFHADLSEMKQEILNRVVDQFDYVKVRDMYTEV